MSSALNALRHLTTAAVVTTPDADDRTVATAVAILRGGCPSSRPGSGRCMKPAGHRGWHGSARGLVWKS
jgi:hypothetical protein